MVCVPCVLVPLLLFLWGLIKPMINWFKKPVENSGDQTNTDDDQVCSLLSSCPCVNTNKQKLPEDKAGKIKGNETLLKESLETSFVDKKNI